MKWATDSGDMQYVEQDSVESAIRMIDYYEEHTGGFRKPLSQTVLVKRRKPGSPC